MYHRRDFFLLHMPRENNPWTDFLCWLISQMTQAKLSYNLYLLEGRPFHLVVPGFNHKPHNAPAIRILAR